jgi:hypothetical protein
MKRTVKFDMPDLFRAEMDEESIAGLRFSHGISTNIIN